MPLRWANEIMRVPYQDCMRAKYDWLKLDWKKWKDEISSAMELFARNEKCDFMQSIGRRGWSYFEGAFESAIILNKVLT